MLIAVLGLATKVYSGPGPSFIRASSGGLFYVMFWCLAVLWIHPRLSPNRIALGVLTWTCALEFLQLWQTPWLETIRSSFIGRTLIGSTFAWSDFPWYFIGAAAAWQIMRKLRH